MVVLKLTATVLPPAGIAQGSHHQQNGLQQLGTPSSVYGPIALRNAHRDAGRPPQTRSGCHSLPHTCCELRDRERAAFVCFVVFMLLGKNHWRVLFNAGLLRLRNVAGARLQCDQTRSFVKVR